MSNIFLTFYSGHIVQNSPNLSLNKDAVVSSTLALPAFASQSYARIVFQDRQWLDGINATKWLNSQFMSISQTQKLPSPKVAMTKTRLAIHFKTDADIDKNVVRCIVRIDYANCVLVGSHYVMIYPPREPILWFDFYHINKNQFSLPTRIIP